MFCDTDMELSDELAFNSQMRCLPTLRSHHQLIAGLLLAVFAMQAAQASYCCDLRMESASNVTATENMPCHDDDDTGLDHDDACCISCISMFPPDQVAPATVVSHHSMRKTQHYCPVGPLHPIDQWEAARLRRS